MFLKEVLLQKKAAVFVAFFAVLVFGLSELAGSWAMAVAGTILLSTFMADLLTKLVFNNLPRKLIEDISNRAVLVTGKHLSVPLELTALTAASKHRL